MVVPGMHPAVQGRTMTRDICNINLIALLRWDLTVKERFTQRIGTECLQNPQDFLPDRLDRGRPTSVRPGRRTLWCSTPPERLSAH